MENMQAELEALLHEIEKEFGVDSDEIVASILCGRSADAAMQEMFM